jgi:hypothetical protein
MTSYNGRPYWADLAEQVSKETDSRKLTVLVEQLCAALDKKAPSGDPADFQFGA